MSVPRESGTWSEGLRQGRLEQHFEWGCEDVSTALGTLPARAVTVSAATIAETSNRLLEL